MIEIKIDNRTLLQQARSGDPEAEQEIINMNLGLVKSALRHFIGRGFEYDDLYQCGCIGLLKAVRNFDPDRECALSTYAVPVIMGEIKRYMRDSSTVKVSRHLKEVSLRTYRARAKLESKLMREPTVSEISAESGDSTDDIVEALDACNPVISIDETVGESENSLHGFLGQDRSDEISEIIALKQGISSLEATERQLICLRYLNGKTQSETAKILKTTQVQVSRKEKSIIEKLRMKII